METGAASVGTSIASSLGSCQTTDRSRTLITSQTTSEVWAGPLPSPEALKKFKSIVPNGAERIVRMVEAEQTHRFEIERANNEADRRNLEENIASNKREQALSRLAIWLGWTVSMICILAALVSVYIGAHWSVPIAFVGLPTMSVVRAFLIRR